MITSFSIRNNANQHHFYINDIPNIINKSRFTQKTIRIIIDTFSTDIGLSDKSIKSINVIAKITDFAMLNRAANPSAIPSPAGSL